MIKRWMYGITGGAAIYPLLILFGLNAVDELDRTGFGILLPDIRDEFGLDLTGLLALIAAVSFVALVLQIPIAHTPTATTGCASPGSARVVWAFFSVLTGLASGRSSCSASPGPAPASARRWSTRPTTRSSPTTTTSPSRPRVYSFHRPANAVGAFIGPLVAGLLAAAFGWRVPFFVFAMPTLDPRRPRPAAAGADARGARSASDGRLGRGRRRPRKQADLCRGPGGSCGRSRRLRRIWYALPFLAVVAHRVRVLAACSTRRSTASTSGPAASSPRASNRSQLLGLILGARIATRLMVTRSGGGDQVPRLRHLRGRRAAWRCSRWCPTSPSPSR